MNDEAVTADSPRIWIKPYYSAFNGLRAVAVLVVFLHHLGTLLLMSRVWDTMFTGVDLFFVLSGFLITGILYDSLQVPHYFRNFYLRRALRIFPLFYGFFVLLFIATPLCHLQWHWNLLTYVFYVGNLYTPFTDPIRANPTTIEYVRHGLSYPILNIGHLWSLCVEEQFYLVWPALVWWVRDRRKLMTLCVIVCVLTLLLRVVLAIEHVGGKSWQFVLLWSTYTRWDTLLCGAFVALWLRERPLTRKQLRRLGAGTLVVGIFSLLAPLKFNLLAVGGGGEVMLSWGLTAVAVSCCGILLLSLDETSGLARVLRWKYLAEIGAISYGIYFYHGLVVQMIFFWAQRISRMNKLLFLADLAGTVGLAWLSFRFYESPFLKLKNRWAPQQPEAHPHVPEPQPAA